MADNDDVFAFGQDGTPVGENPVVSRAPELTEVDLHDVVVVASAANELEAIALIDMLAETDIPAIKHGGLIHFGGSGPSEIAVPRKLKDLALEEIQKFRSSANERGINDAFSPEDTHPHIESDDKLYPNTAISVAIDVQRGKRNWGIGIGCFGFLLCLSTGLALTLNTYPPASVLPFIYAIIICAEGVFLSWTSNQKLSRLTSETKCEESKIGRDANESKTSNIDILRIWRLLGTICLCIGILFMAGSIPSLFFFRVEPSEPVAFIWSIFILLNGAILLVKTNQKLAVIEGKQ